MIKFKVDGVEVFNPLKGKLNALIEYFVKFYGEEYRERITNRLTNTAYIFTGEVGAINSHSTCDDLEEYYDKKIERLTKEEYCDLKFQSETSSWDGYGGVRKLPYAFTEQGVAMLATVLRTKVAEEVSIKIMDAFVAMRNILLVIL